MEPRTRRILYAASALEFGILIKSLLNKPASNEELHMFVDEDTKHSRSFFRLWLVFLVALGGSRLALAQSNPGPSKELKGFALVLHIAELIFFYTEALTQQRPLKPANYAFLAILWGLPYTIVTKID